MGCQSQLSFKQYSLICTSENQTYYIIQSDVLPGFVTM